MAQPLTSEAVTYTWQQLLVRAGADPNAFPSALSYGTIETEAPARVAVRACDTQEWYSLLENESHKPRWLSTLAVVPTRASMPFSDPMPVLIWGKGVERNNSPFAELEPDVTLLFHAGIIAPSFFMLFRWEVTITKCHDQHGRFPSTASVACRHGFLHRPIVDEYALILREWLTTWWDYQERFGNGYGSKSFYRNPNAFNASIFLRITGPA